MLSRKLLVIAGMGMMMGMFFYHPIPLGVWAY